MSIKFSQNLQAAYMAPACESVIMEIEQALLEGSDGIIADDFTPGSDNWF